MNNAVFEKAIENVKKPNDITLVTTEGRRNYLVSELNFHIEKVLTEKLLAIAMKKTEIRMNKDAYLRLSILELNKILKYKFWYDFVEPMDCENAKLCYISTDRIIVHVKTDNIYRDIAYNCQTRFDNSILEYTGHYLNHEKHCWIKSKDI